MKRQETKNSAPSTTLDPCSGRGVELVHTTENAEINCESNKELLNESHVSTNDSVTEVKKRIHVCTDKVRESHHTDNMPFI